MKRLKAKEIKKILLGIVLSDGCIDKRVDRFDFYSKQEDYAKYVYAVLEQITGMYVTFKVVKDKRGYIGYRVFTRKHAYWNNMRKHTYSIRKNLNRYNVSRLDEEALAHIWMCDGYLEHAKNRRINKIQNIGWFCLEAFPKEELELLQKHLKDTWDIDTTLVKKPWGFGHRLRVGGINLQKFISIVYPYILDCFKYKTSIFYKKIETADLSLSNAKQYIHIYTCIEDIVRHS